MLHVTSTYCSIFGRHPLTGFLCLFPSSSHLSPRDLSKGKFVRDPDSSTVRQVAMRKRACQKSTANFSSAVENTYQDFILRGRRVRTRCLGTGVRRLRAKCRLWYYHMRRPRLTRWPNVSLHVPPVATAIRARSRSIFFIVNKSYLLHILPLHAMLRTYIRLQPRVTEIPRLPRSHRMEARLPTRIAIPHR